MRWLLLIFISCTLVILTSCQGDSREVTVRKFYNCCDSSCLDSAHLLRQEQLDENNRVINFIEYNPEGYAQLFVKLFYHEQRLISRTDSSLLTTEQANYFYDNSGELTSKTIYRFRQMVFNEHVDTIPHTEWRLVIDTVQYFYRKKQSIVEEWEVTTEDSIIIKSTFLDEKNRAAEISYASSKEKYFYTNFDSVSRIERWSFTASSSNTSNYKTSDLKWRLYSSVNQFYDSLNRLIRREINDNQIEETVDEEIVSYDSQGRLISIQSRNSCTSVVYAQVNN